MKHFETFVFASTFIRPGTVLSIAFFNFAGVSVTKELSATTRTVLDSVRTFIIWIASILIPGLQGKFSWMQLGGFVVLLLGMFVYNDVLIRPVMMKLLGREEDTVSIVNEEAGEGTHRPGGRVNAAADYDDDKHSQIMS